MQVTTEYTPQTRPAPGSVHPPPPKPATPTPQIAAKELHAEAADGSSTQAMQTDATPGLVKAEEGAVTSKPSDPSLLNLPPAVAPPSAPKIDPTEPGVLSDGTSVFDIDMTNFAEKSWRRPGSDLSDWFNYGFDEISWEAYCIRRRELGEAAAMLKGAVMVRSSPLRCPSCSSLFHRIWLLSLRSKYSTYLLKCVQH